MIFLDAQKSSLSLGSPHGLSNKADLLGSVAASGVSVNTRSMASSAGI